MVGALPRAVRTAAHAIGARLAPMLLSLTGDRKLWILNYHRINDRTPDFLLDSEVISATPDQFARDIAFCARHFDLVSFADVAAWLDHTAPLPRKPLIVSFDDGYRDNYEFAFPVLKSHRASGTFFLAVDFVEDGELFWWDEVAYLIKACQGTSLRIRIGTQPCEFDLTGGAQRAACVRSILSRLKQVSNVERIDSIARLAAAVNGRLGAPRPARQTMTWADARTMVLGGMEIGSHSMSHPVLSQVESDAQLRAEVESSKAILQERLGTEVLAFSYPVGGRVAFNDRVTDLVRQAGYRFAVSYVHAVNDLRKPDWYALRRLHVDGIGSNEFRSGLLLASF